MIAVCHHLCSQHIDCDCAQPVNLLTLVLLREEGIYRLEHVECFQ